MEKRKIKTATAVIIVLMIMILLLTKKTVKTDDNLLMATEEFDYNSMEVQEAIKKISGTTDMKLLENTLDYINNNIVYDSNVAISTCYKETASGILKKGSGDCVSMSRVLVAMLRGQNIQARTAGGCVREAYTCGTLFAIPVLERPERIKDITDIKKRGYLHEWVEVIIDNSIYLVDPTSNNIFYNSCTDYRLYSYDTNNIERCVISDSNFINQCYNWR